MKFSALAPRSFSEVGPKFYRFILVFFLFAILYLIFAIVPASATSDVASAQTNPYTVPNTNPDVPRNLHTWTQNVMIEVMSAMSCQLSGIDPTDPKGKCLGVDQKTGKIGYVEGGGGAIGVAGKMIGMLYTPPLHTSDYFKYLASNFGIAKPAYGATGFEGLKPVQSLWVAFRNIVYLLFVIVFIVIGIAIMFRVRIDPRTVMTIQNQIPKIIIGILLVTFSFAIAGFLIDLMYVVIFLSYELISGAVTGTDFSKLNPLNISGQNALRVATHIHPLGIFGIAHSGAVAVKDVIQDMLKIDSSFNSIFNPFSFVWHIADVIKGNPSVADLLIDAISYGAGTFAFFKVAGLEQTFTTPIIGDILNAIIGAGKYAAAVASGAGAYLATQSLLRIGLPYLIAYLIIFIALLIALFRLWFVLLMAYVGILLDVVFAPFWIAGALLPGSPIGFGAWLRSIVANLAAFPAVIIMFLLAKAFIDGIGACKLPGCDPNTVFVPPLVGDLPGTDAIGALIGLGIILMTPNVVAMVRAAFGVKGAGVGPMIVGGLAGGLGAPGGMLATAGHLGGALYGLSHLPVIGNIGPLRRIRQGYQQPPPTT